jgi:hypothetical protein
MNKKGPSLSLINHSFYFWALYTTVTITKRMTTACTWLTGRDICGFIDHCDITCQDTACDSYVWYSLTRILNPGVGGNTILWSFLNCLKSTRIEPSACISSTAKSPWNWEKVSPADWTEQFLYCSCHTDEVSAVQSKFKCLNDSSVVNALMVNLFNFQK